MVVAFSNAQAKNISTDKVKARTCHTASCMRVQKYVNVQMRPDEKQRTLERPGHRGGQHGVCSRVQHDGL